MPREMNLAGKLRDCIVAEKWDAAIAQGLMHEAANELDHHSTWHPISTAPKDGTEILLTDGHYKRTGYFATMINSWSIDMVPPITMPTHWMSLAISPYVK